MAIFRCQVKSISRSSGRTSVAAAAYRAGEKLYSEYEGIYHDYSRKKYVVHSEIQLPPHAPREYYNRQTLWNAVEASENAKDARVAREVEIALPMELNAEQQKQLVRKYVRDTFVSLGMCADWHLHNPPVRDDLKRSINKYGLPTNDISEMTFRNPHIHIMLTVRGIDEKGQWEPKTQIEYLCINSEGKEAGLTAEELKERAFEGWKKQYRYHNGAEFVWMTREQGEAMGLELVNKYPKTSYLGRQNPHTAYWNSPEFVRYCRKAWEKACNEALEKAGCQERIDCRSYEEQGVLKIPQVPLSYGQVKMERRASRLKSNGKTEADIIHTDLACINTDIRKYNNTLDALQKKIATKQEEAALSIKDKVGQLKDIKDQLVIVRTNKKRLEDSLIKTSSSLESIQSRLDTYNQSIREANGKTREHTEILAELQEELFHLSTKDKKYKTLSEDIQNEQDTISRFQEHIQELKESYGYSDKDLYDQNQKDAYRFVEDLKDIEEKLSELSQKEEELKNHYREVKSSMESPDGFDDNRNYSDYTSTECVEYVVDDIIGLTGMLTHAFEEKKKKRQRQR